MAPKKKKKNANLKVMVDRRALVAFILIPLLCLAVWKFWAAPAKEAEALATDRLEESQGRVDDTQDKLDEIALSGKSKAEQLYPVATKLDTLLPLAINGLDVTIALGNLAANAGLTEVFIKPQAGAPESEAGQSIPITLTAKGRPEQWAVFVSSLQQNNSLSSGSVGMGLPVVTVHSTSFDEDGSKVEIASKLRAWYSGEETLQQTQTDQG